MPRRGAVGTFRRERPRVQKRLRAQRWRLRWHGVPLGARLMAVLLVGGLVSTALLVRAHVRERRRVQAHLERELLSLVERVSQEDEELLGRVQMLLRVVSTSDQLLGPPEECGAFLWEMQEQETAVMSIAVADLSGRVRCASHPFPGELSIADRDYFQETLQQRRIASGNFAVDRLTGRAAIHFSQPVLERGELRAVTVLALDISWLDGYARRVDVPKEAVVLAWDEAGTIIASYPNPERWVGTSIAGTELMTRSLKSDEGLLRMPWRGSDHLWAFTSVGREQLDRPAYIALTMPTESVLAGPERELRNALLLLWGVGLLAAAALLAIVYAWILRPLRQLERAAALLGRGELGARTHVGAAPSELGRVTAAFDAMASAFEESTRSREEFISMVAHELKGPLTTFKLHLQRLRHVAESERLIPQPMVQQTVESADRQVWRLTQLVESLLESRAITEELRPLALEPVDLVEAVREVVTHHEPSFAAAGTPLTVTLLGEAEGGQLVGLWDRPLLVQLLHQLISNALKFGEGQPVTLTVFGEGDGVRLTVHDEGVGIDPLDELRAFEPFERAVPVHSHGGLGLGLWVVRQLARRLQGEVTLQSRRGEGSTFTVTLSRELARSVVGREETAEDDVPRAPPPASAPASAQDTGPDEPALH